MRGTDVIVVGGGVIGLSAACSLAGAGARVVVLERGQVGSGASGAAAGMLAPLSEADEAGPFLDLALRSLRLYPSWVAGLKEASGVDPEYVASGTLRVALTQEDLDRLRARAAWQRLVGIPVEVLDGPAALERGPGLAEGLLAAAWYPQEAHVYSPRLVRALAGAARARGVEVREGQEVAGLLEAEVPGSGGRTVRQARGVRLAGGEAVPAGAVVLAAGAWSGVTSQWLGQDVPVAPVKGQLLALENQAAGPHPIAFGRHAYTCAKLNGTIVTGATEEDAGFDTRVTAAGLAHVLEGALSLRPALAGAPLRHAWAGLRPGSPDRLPIIGSVPGWEGVFLATGHYRNGILLAPITGWLVASLVAGGAGAVPPATGAVPPAGAGEPACPDLSPFDPARFLDATKKPPEAAMR